MDERIGFVRSGDRDGEQSISNGLRVSISKAFLRQIVKKRGAKGFVKLPQFAFFTVFVLHEVYCGVVDVFGQLGKFFGEFFSGANYMAGFVLEGFGPLFAPAVYVGGVLRPLEAGCKCLIHIVGFEFGIVAVPAEDAQGWGFVGVRFLVEVSE